MNCSICRHYCIRLVQPVTIALTVGMVATLEPVSAQTFIRNQAQVPRWNQHHDYRNIYQNLTTDMPLANQLGAFVTYSNLAGDPRIFFSPANSPLYYVNPAAPRTKFMAIDYYTGNAGGNDLAGGGWHCAPTATGMWMEWLRQNSLTRLANRGGEVASITGFAQDADTNDQNPNIRAFDNVGHLGTYRPEMVNAANAYVRNSYSGIINAIFGPRIAAWNYSPNAYRQMIDRNKPPVVFYENLDQNGQPTGSGHVVVGVGYDAQNVIVADPWDATTKLHAFNTIRQLGGGGGGTLYGAPIVNPPSADFNADWTGTRLHVMEIPDWGDAPYEYLSNRPTAHVSGLREWLGNNVSGEVDPFNAVDDVDRIANVNNHDRYDDGIKFLNFNLGGQGTIEAIISSISGMSLDPLFEQDLPPILNLNGWIDWNNNKVWEESEQILHWESPADFDGSQTLQFNFDIPTGSKGQYWSRFRLDRGQNVGPYGLAQFGEVEDYRVGVAVPEPTSTLSFLAFGTLGAASTLKRKQK